VLSVTYAECHLCWVSHVSIICWVLLCWMSLCWVSLCWMSLWLHSSRTMEQHILMCQSLHWARLKSYQNLRCRWSQFTTKLIFLMKKMYFKQFGKVKIVLNIILYIFEKHNFNITLLIISFKPYLVQPDQNLKKNFKFSF